MKIQLPEKFKFKDHLRSVIAIGVTALMLIVGVFAYLGRYAYAEDGHNWYLFFYILTCGGLFWGIRRMNIGLIIAMVLLGIGIQVFANQKFNWRYEYVENALAGKHFELSEFIHEYPTYEQYLFNITGAPDWVRLNRQCIQPALNEQSTHPNCATTDMIFNNYNIDIIDEMRRYANRMRATAKQLDEGKLKRRHEYQACIQRGQCATIPLLPKGVDAEQIDPMSQDYLDIRQAYWSLVNDKTLTPAVCSLTPMCKAMVKMGLVQPNSLPF